MRPFWLIECDTFGSSIEPLKTEIRRQGMTFGVIRHESFTSGYQTHVGTHELTESDCVIFIGTWPLWRHIQLHWSSWIPGGWCPTESLDCATYYPRFSPYLLNQHSEILTGIEAIRRQKELFASYSKSGHVFIRPTGCLKVFNGRCVDESSFVSALQPTRYDPETRIVVSEPKEIGREWRFVIAEHRPLAVSQYYDEGIKSLVAGCPREIWVFVDRVLRDVAWEPDDVFVMDVCESEGKPFVLELNGFSCAGLYECDLTKIVAKASELAESAWNRKYRPL